MSMEICLIQASAVQSGRVSFNVEGFWVEPKYDPFVIKMERPSDVQSPGSLL